MLPRRLGFAVSLLTVALGAAAARAQSVGKMLERDFRDAGKDMGAVWASPFRGDGSDWLVAAAGIVGAAALSPWDDDVDRWMVVHHDSRAWFLLKQFREGGIAFSGRTVVPAASGLLVIALATNSRPMQDGIFGCVASYVSGSIVRNYVVYRLVARRRPVPDRNAKHPPPAEPGDQYVFGFPGGRDWGNHSLPAGHVANVFACATFLSHRFNLGAGEPALYLLTTGIGVGRMIDRRHWLSDTVLGMIFGFAIGKEIGRRSRDRANDSDDAMRAATMAAHAGGIYLQPSRGGLSFGLHHGF
jgi:membrane-associated phospholipid phosphatase